MYRLGAVLALIAVVRAQTHSVSSCGKPGDIFSNATFTSSPDPIVKTAPLTITATGTLLKAMTGGNFNVDLTIKALGIINEPVKASSPFTFSPGFVAGPAKIVVGPFNLPSIPGTAVIAGTIVATDSAGNEVFCIALNINAVDEDSSMPSRDALNAREALNASERFALFRQEVADPVTDCSGASDHLHNRVLSNTGGVVGVSGDLDEDVSSLTVVTALNVQVSFIKIPVNLNIPVSISPAIPKGHLALTIGPSTTLPDANAIKVIVKGDVKINDASSSEILCLAIDAE